ncbi:hypothetical protein GIW70_07630 [Pseudomonas syringae]|nr:hypothetical protein [Pseudomonas syringae]MCF5068066.1 hypothetical protein [Pseudomonas syringae]
MIRRFKPPFCCKQKPRHVNGGAFFVWIVGDGDDRKLHVAGTVNSDAGVHYLLGRLRSDGSLDSDFAETGIVTGQFPEHPNSRGHSLAVQEDGKILLFGEVFLIFLTMSAAVRYNADGPLGYSPIIHSSAAYNGRALLFLQQLRCTAYQ